MYKPKVRVNVAEGAYVVILNWQAEGSAVEGAGVSYVSNNGKARIQVSGDRFQGFIVSKFHARGICIAARVDQGVRRENALMGRWWVPPRAWGPSTPLSMTTILETRKIQGFVVPFLLVN